VSKLGTKSRWNHLDGGSGHEGGVASHPELDGLLEPLDPPSQWEILLCSAGPFTPGNALALHRLLPPVPLRLAAEERHLEHPAPVPHWLVPWNRTLAQTFGQNRVRTKKTPCRFPAGTTPRTQQLSGYIDGAFGERSHDRAKARLAETMQRFAAQGGDNHAETIERG